MAELLSRWRICCAPCGVDGSQSPSPELDSVSERWSIGFKDDLPILIAVKSMDDEAAKAAQPDSVAEQPESPKLESRGADSNRKIVKRISEDDLQQIRKDLPRTFVEQPDVLAHSSIIEQVLVDYASVDPDVGYCQGMNFVAAVHSVQFRDSLHAYAHFHELLSKTRGLWLPGFPLLQLGMVAFEAFCNCEHAGLLLHLGSVGLALDMFLPDAWLTLFARWLPFSMLAELYAFIEAEGFASILSITVALLAAHSSKLMASSDFTALFVLLKTLGKQSDQPPVEDLLSSAQDLLPAARKALSAAESSADLVVSHSTSTVTRCGSKVMLSGLPVTMELLGETPSCALGQLIVKVSDAANVAKDKAMDAAVQVVDAAKAHAIAAAAEAKDMATQIKEDLVSLPTSVLEGSTKSFETRRFTKKPWCCLAPFWRKRIQ